MTNVRDIRNETRRLIEQQTEERKREIAAMRDSFARKEAELQRAAEEEQRRLERQLREMEARQRRAVAAAQHDLAEQSRIMAAELSDKLNALARQTRETIERNRKDLEARIARKYEEIERRIQALYDSIADQDEREAAYAGGCVDRARDVLAELQDSQAVQMFKAFLLPSLVEQYNAIAHTQEMKLWVAAAAEAKSIEITGEGVLAEAEFSFAQWDAKRRSLIAQLQKLMAALVSAEVKEYEMGEYYCPARIRDWGEEPFAQLQSTVQERLDALNAVPPAPLCDMDTLDMMLLYMPGLQEQLRQANSAARHVIYRYLTTTSVLDTIEMEMGMYGSGWYVMQRPVQEEFTGEVKGELRLSDTPDGSGDLLSVTVRSIKADPEGIRLTFTYDSPKSETRCRTILNQICNHLAIALGGGETDALTTSAIDTFRNGQMLCAAFSVIPADSGKRDEASRQEQDDVAAGETGFDDGTSTTTDEKKRSETK